MLAHTGWTFGGRALRSIRWQASRVGRLRLHGESVESRDRRVFAHPTGSHQSCIFTSGMSSNCDMRSNRPLSNSSLVFSTFQFDGVHVVSGSLDTSIRVWDAATGACKHTLMGHQSLTSGMELRQNILVSGNADSTVKVWDITTGQCLQTLSGMISFRSTISMAY